MATLVIRYPDGSEQEAELSGQLTVGRADGNDLVLAEGGVSRKHARFFTKGADIMVEDAGSQNGTWVDGEKIDGPTKVGSRAQVVIGDYEISVRGNGAKPAAAKSGLRPKANVENSGIERPTSAAQPVRAARATKVVPAAKAPGAGAAIAKRPRPAPAAQAPSGPVLRGLTGPWLNKTFSLKGTMVIGRVPGVDIQIEDDSVSRRHAEIVLQGRDVVLRDLGSANGTTVNGAPLTEEMVLAPGDIIQFGVVEMTFEVPSGALARRGGKLAKQGDTGGEDEPPQRSGRTKIFIAGGVVMALLFVGVVVKLLSAPPPTLTPTPMSPGGGPATEGNLDAMLGEIRQLSSPDLGEPNWERALDLVNKVLESDPINEEANELKRRIVKEKECKDEMDKGLKLAQRLREEEALEHYAKIKEDCSYYYKVKPKITDAIDAVKKKAKGECDQYFDHSQFKEALPRCQKYMEFACQEMQPSELYPAGTQVLCLTPSRNRKCWTPKDRTYSRFLQAKDRIDPGGPLWRCPELAILRKPKPPPDPGAAAKEDIKKRIKDADVADAVVIYFEGKDNEAVNALQRVREKTEKAAFHKQAEDIQKNISSVEGLFKEGETHLSNEEPEKAEEPFREALALDEKIVLGEEFSAKPEPDKKPILDKFKSYLRKNVQQDMSSKCYSKGKFYMDRKDEKRACKLWRLGFSFYKGNSDLLKAVTNICTQRAHQFLEEAGDCPSLSRVLDYEVTGDGTKEEYEKKKEELKCP